MRCSTCHSYIPEGLPTPVVCPQCGRQAENQHHQDEVHGTPEPIAAAANTTIAQAFAPFFSIPTRLFYGSLHETVIPHNGSLSFGPEGFSIVWDDGRGWQKILYRDLESAIVANDSVRLTIKGTESKLVFFHPWIPMGATRRARARLFVELLSHVRQGLSGASIETYRAKLQG